MVSGTYMYWPGPGVFSLPGFAKDLKEVALLGRGGPKPTVLVER